jgi:hypothetical protein
VQTLIVSVSVGTAELSGGTRHYSYRQSRILAVLRPLRWSSDWPAPRQPGGLVATLRPEEETEDDRPASSKARTGIRDRRPRRIVGGRDSGELESIPTKLKMRNSAPAFHSKVKSVAPECESDRRVKLFRERIEGSRRVLLGRADETWLIEVDPLRSGYAYYAKAKQHLVEIDGLMVRCEPDFGRAILVD